MGTEKEWRYPMLLGSVVTGLRSRIECLYALVSRNPSESRKLHSLSPFAAVQGFALMILMPEFQGWMKTSGQESFAGLTVIRTGGVSV